MGKHPAAADFINLGDGPAVLDAVADWMTEGYGALQREGSQGDRLHSWRFWLRGAGRGCLICGLGRDSSDRIGRPFPLFIVGEGPLEDWEQDWPRLPRLLAGTWEGIERMAARRHESLQGLVDAMRYLEAPDPEGGGTAAQTGDTIAPHRLEAFRGDLHRSGRAMVPLDPTGDADPALDALTWHEHLKVCCTDIPRAVFLGGNPLQPNLAVIQGPLRPADFVMLWSV